MRKVFYYDNIIPPKDWLIYASLLWDKVWAGTVVEQIIKYYADQLQSDQDGKFFYELFSNTDIIDTAILSQDISLMPEELQGRHNRYIANLSKILDCFIEGQSFEIHRQGQTEPISVDLNPKQELGPATYESIISFCTALSNSQAPYWAQQSYPDLDFFFIDQSTFQKCHSLNANVFVASIEAVIPINVDMISIAQLVEFRETTQLQRVRFGKEADRLFTDILNCSTEQDLRTQTNLCVEYIREQLNLLEIAYRTYKLEAVKKAMGITFTAPALLVALSSALHIPFYIPAAIVSSLSLASAEILLTLEKGKSEIYKSPWGYLTRLQKP